MTGTAIFQRLAGALIALSSATPVIAQARGTVRGVVTDSLGRAIIGAQVGVVDTDIRSVSDTAGAYVLPGVWPGAAALRIRHIGFQPETLAVLVRAMDTTRADVVLRVMVVTLPALQTTDDALGKMAGFRQRRARGVGAFITRADIEKRQPPSLGEMLRSVAGVSVNQTERNDPLGVQMGRAVSSSNGACVVQLYVDGQPYPGGAVNDFPPQTVEGVEIYRGPSEIPPSFRTRNASCGVIAIWTRDPEAARRSP